MKDLDLLIFKTIQGRGVFRDRMSVKPNESRVRPLVTRFGHDGLSYKTLLSLRVLPSVIGCAPITREVTLIKFIPSFENFYKIKLKLNLSVYTEPYCSRPYSMNIGSTRLNFPGLNNNERKSKTLSFTRHYLYYIYVPQ